MTDCPECGTRNYKILPSYGNCQTCLGLRLKFLVDRQNRMASMIPPGAKIKVLAWPKL
jgi:hypothetical protein